VGDAPIVACSGGTETAASVRLGRRFVGKDSMVVDSIDE